jgi:beta-glucosidase
LAKILCSNHLEHIGRDRTSSWIPEIILREYFLPPFAAGVAAGAPTVMINSGDVNGIPGHANKHYITDILKGEMAFSGFTVSDWEDVIRLYTRDKVAETPEEAVKISVMAGLDMSMVPSDFSFHGHCVNLANSNPEFLARVNDANKRILEVKKMAGLFENSYPFVEDLKNINTNDSKDFNLQAARESIVLVKNNANVLPLNIRNKTILVAGPSANILRTLNGGWSYTWQGRRYLKEVLARNYVTVSLILV